MLGQKELTKGAGYSPDVRRPDFVQLSGSFLNFSKKPSYSYI